MFENKNLAKYLNISETEVFKKEKIIYNINCVKNQINKKNNIIILEGYIDVISLNKININNTIAIMGTNLSNYHIQKIKKLTNECILFLDGDKAGIQASLNISKKLLINNFTVKIVYNDTNNDPDELINNNKEQLIHNMILNAQHPISFAINYFSIKYNLDDGNDLIKFINLIGSFLILIKNPLEQELYLNKLSDITHINKINLLNQINKLKNYFTKKTNKIFLLNSFNNNFNNNHNNNNYNNNNNINNYLIIKEKQYKLAENNLILQLLGDRKALIFFNTQIGFLNDNNHNLLVNEIISYYNKYVYENNININKLFLEINNKELSNILLKIVDNNLIANKMKYNLKVLKDLKILINDFVTEKEIKMLIIQMHKQNNILDKQMISAEIDKMHLRLQFKIKGVI